MDIRLEPIEGRFAEAFRAANVPPGCLEIEVFDREGHPWMIHPSWGNNPETPAILTAVVAIPAVVDRAVDLRLNAYWRADHPIKDPELRLMDYVKWAREQRARIGHAIVRHLLIRY